MLVRHINEDGLWGVGVHVGGTGDEQSEAALEYLDAILKNLQNSIALCRYPFRNDASCGAIRLFIERCARSTPSVKSDKKPSLPPFAAHFVSQES